MTTARNGRPQELRYLAPDAPLPPLAACAISLPAGVRPFKLNWPYIIVIGAYHALAVLAFMPGYFSWSGLIVAYRSAPICAGCSASTFATIGFSPIAA